MSRRRGKGILVGLGGAVVAVMLGLSGGCASTGRDSDGVTAAATVVGCPAAGFLTGFCEGGQSPIDDGSPLTAEPRPTANGFTEYGPHW